MTAPSPSSGLQAKAPAYSRSTSRDSRVAYFPTQPEGLVVPDGAVSERAAELLADLSTPRSERGGSGIEAGKQHFDMDAGYHERMEHAKRLPWWRRPSPWWILGMMPFSAIAMSATLAPKIEIYTLLACSTHKPDIFRQTLPTLGGMIGVIKPIGGIIQPIVGNYTSALGSSFEETLGSQTCAADPTVQAAVAKLTAVISATMGVLSCITTGFWGSFSDRNGRTRVMGISIIGLLASDAVLIITTLNVRSVPGGYWFLILGPLIEGSLGGLTTATAACHAYISDTTTESARSRTLSLSLGLMFSGMAFGPTIGSIFVRSTGKALAPFYMALAVHILFTVFIWTIYPEPLLENQKAEAKKAYDEERKEFTDSIARVGGWSRAIKRTRRVLGFLSPLSVFVEEAVAQTEELERRRNPLKKCQGRDWNLLLLAMAYGFALTIMGSYSYKFQYAAATFHWTSEQLGYWLSVVGFTRGLFLTLILPVVIKLAKPKPFVVEIQGEPGSRPTSPSRHVRSPSREASPNTGDEEQPLLSSEPPHSRTIKKEIHSPSFDMSLARISLFIEVVSYTLMAVSFSAMAFTLSSIFGSFGTGFSPAIQSVALAMYMRKGGTETGRLFGALSVVQAICAQILGPAMYGLVYMKTVATYPKAIFYVSVITVVLSFLCLSFVRVPKVDGLAGQVGRGGAEGRGEEEALISDAA